MKKLILIVIVIAGLIFFFKNNFDSKPTQNNTPNVSGEANPLNATFSFDDGSVTLSDGVGDKEGAEGGFSERVELLEERATGDLNGDSKNDSVVLLARSGGGSGVFIYVAAYISGPVGFKGSNAIFLGDRISPQSIEIVNSVAKVNYLDRKPDEPFAAEPTVPMTEEFVYRDGAFRER